jgi:LysR family transcriptional regulator, hydrogen peroxide-inducible genes activator
MPSLRQLQYLLALSETGHYRLAAEKVGVSQPTLSAQLLALERRLGVQLAERNRAPVIMTSAGEQVLAVAKRIVVGVQEIQGIAQTHRRGMSGVVRLGVPTSISPHLLPAFIPALHSDFPNLRFHIRENFPLSLPDELASGKHDLLILPLPLRGEDFETLRVFREPLYLAVPRDHRFAQQDCISANDLRDEPVLALEAGHALHEQVNQICEEFGARLLHDFEGTSLNTLHQMVASGLGLTFLPGLYAHSIAKSDVGVKLLTIKGKPLHRAIGLIWRSSSPQIDDFRRIANYLRDAVKRNYPDFMLFEQ